MNKLGTPRFYRLIHGFWIFETPDLNRIIIRFGLGSLLIYSLLIRIPDWRMQSSAITNIVVAGYDTPFYEWAMRINILNWFADPIWIWVVHIVFILSALALAFNYRPALMSLICVALQFFYISYRPALFLSFDGLMFLVLFYLAITELLATFEHRILLSSVAWRTFQLHLCVLYFQSGIGRLHSDWLSGIALQQPNLQEIATSTNLILETGNLMSVVLTAVILFDLFYGVLVWIHPLRLFWLLLMVIVHLVLGFIYSAMLFNLLMIVASLVFLNRYEMQTLMHIVYNTLIYLWNMGVKINDAQRKR